LDAAVESRFWPLYEVVDGRYRLTYEPRHTCDVEEWLRPQKRFAHLTPQLIDEIRRQIDADWQALKGGAQ
jgi:pyruvate ferredoxin oxidoreductase beta subunit